MGFFGNSKELQFGTCYPWQTTGKSGEQSRVTFFYRGEGGLGGAVITKRAHWRKLGVRSVVAFHWLSCGNLSVELLLGKKKIFLLLVVKQCHFLPEVQGTALFVGICIDGKW